MCEIFHKIVAFSTIQRYNITSEVDLKRIFRLRQGFALAGKTLARPIYDGAPSGFAIDCRRIQEMQNEKLRNIAIIAHVDHGKTAPQN